jgi:hypothetical protein
MNGIVTMLRAKGIERQCCTGMYEIGYTVTISATIFSKADVLKRRLHISARVRFWKGEIERMQGPQAGETYIAEYIFHG